MGIYNKKKLSLLNTETIKNSQIHIGQIYLYFSNIIKYFVNNNINYNNIIEKIISDFKTNIIIHEYKKKKDNENKKFMNLVGVELLSSGAYGQIYKLSNDYCMKIIFYKNEEEEISENYHEYKIPLEIIKIENELSQLIMKPIGLIKHCCFNGLFDIFQLNILVIYSTYCFIKNKKFNTNHLYNKLKNYEIDLEYKEIFNNNNIEIFSKSISFSNFIFEKYIKLTSINLLEKFYQILKILKSNKKNNNKKGFIIFLPLAHSISTNIFLDNNKKINNNGIKANIVMEDIYRLLTLQMSLIILKLNQNKNIFIHNDLKHNNILTINKNHDFNITYDNIKFIFKENFNFVMADFDFSILNNIINNKIRKSIISKYKSWFFDIHFFCHNLFYFLKEEDIKIDIIFFKKIHEIFIYPFCNIKFEKDIYDSKIIKDNEGNVICCYGRYKKFNNIPDISILENFIKSDLFMKWNNKIHNYNNSNSEYIFNLNNNFLEKNKNYTSTSFIDSVSLE